MTVDYAPRASERDAETWREDEFDRQVAMLIRKGYPEIAGLTAADFSARLEPLRRRLGETGAGGAGAETANVPFVIVVQREWVAPERAMPLTELGGRPGLSVMDGDDLRKFGPIPGLSVPEGPAYLLADMDTGADTLNVRPNDALGLIARQNRSPLTIAEGVAVVTQFPDILRRRNCFSLLGSRCGDRRVAALWVSAGRPKLGWCWAGNPHTWLGSASCARRVGME